MRHLIAGTAALALIAGAVPAVSAAERTVSPEARSGLALTLYADGFGLIKDRRTVELDEGGNILAFEGVSSKMIPSSALVRTDPGLTVREQNFDFDLITPQALLERSVGKTVRVVRTHPTSGEDVVEEAEVLAAGNGGTVLRIGDRIETGVPGRLVFDEVPEGLRARPALLLDVESDAAAEREVQLAYLSEGLSWRAEYVAELAPDGKTLDLGAWASLSNSTGTEFAGATVQMVAGDVQREMRRKTLDAAPMMARANMVAAESAGASQETLGELHLYSLPRAVTLKNNQTKQVALLSAAGVGVAREYRRERWVPDNRTRFSAQAPDVVRPQASLRFDNETENGLGVPLPAGLVRVYERDAEGRLQFSGEQSTGHTAKGEDVVLSLGEAVDIGLTYTQTDYTAGGKDAPFETAQEVRLTNAKEEPVTVRVVERFSGAAEILSESQGHDAFSGQQAQWAVEVPAGGETVLSYRVRVSRAN